jgi:hypothetical protein
MDNAIYAHLSPKVVNAIGLDLTVEGNRHLSLMFMRSIKRAKEMLSNLTAVCQCVSMCRVY